MCSAQGKHRGPLQPGAVSSPCTIMPGQVHHGPGPARALRGTGHGILNRDSRSMNLNILRVRPHGAPAPGPRRTNQRGQAPRLRAQVGPGVPQEEASLCAPRDNGSDAEIHTQAPPYPGPDVTADKTSIPKYGGGSYSERVLGARAPTCIKVGQSSGYCKRAPPASQAPPKDQSGPRTSQAHSKPPGKPAEGEGKRAPRFRVETRMSLLLSRSFESFVCLSCFGAFAT
jgi:hypothetical protein